VRHRAEAITLITSITSAFILWCLAQPCGDQGVQFIGPTQCTLSLSRSHCGVRIVW
jgi:hypothetical protein